MKMIKISQSYRDELLKNLCGNDFIDNSKLISVGDTVQAKYNVDSIKVKISGTVIGFHGKLINRKVSILTIRKDFIKLPLNSLKITFSILKKSRFKIRRSKIYYLNSK